MAEKEKEPVTHPTVSAHDGAGSDTEAAAAAHGSRNHRKLRRTKCLVFILVFMIFHAAIILLFTQTVLKVRTPKFRLSSASFEDFNGGAPTNSSFEGRMKAELSVKNPNFGRYKYRNATVFIYHRDSQVGEASVPSSHADWRSTKNFEIRVDLRFANGQENSRLSSDLSSGIVPVTCRSRLRGRVEVVILMKKRRSTEMNCSMEIVTATGQLRNIVCN